MSKTKQAEATTPLTKKSWKAKICDQKYIIIAFFLPFLLLGIAFAVNGVYPFGTKQIMVTDFWQQYYPFYCDFQSKLQEGSSLLYSWSAGLGTNYVALIAYYLASPLNFFLVFVPPEFLREALTLFLLIKIGCAGMFFAIFLRSVFKRNDFSIVFFSVLYGLCAFVMGYYWNIIWFDTFALLPLVVLGVYALVTRGKYKLFIVALALSMLTNYYMGFFTCIFTAITFFGVCIAVKMTWKAFFKKLGLIIGFSALAIGISAVLVAPAYIALQNTHGVQNVLPDFTTLYDWNYKDPLTYATDILGNLAAFTKPTDKEGLPNIYCGFICVILGTLFFRSKKISVREKVFSTVVLIFFMYCCMYKLPNFIIHGMHLPNMLPYRFAYLMSFVLIVMAYRGFLLLKDINYGDVFAMAIVGAVFAVFAYAGSQADTAVTGTVALLIVYLALILLYKLNIFPQAAMTIGIFALILVEMCSSALIGVNTVRTTDRTSYPDQYEPVTKLISDIEASDDEPFYRMETQHFYTINDSTIYGYNGATLFSSTVNEGVTKFVEGVGLIGWDAGNRYYYAETSPLTNAFLDIKYMIGRRTTAKNTDDWSLIQNYNYANSYSNNSYLSLGFMTKDTMKDFMYGYTKTGAVSTNPFDTQNNLFTKSTGIQEDVFTPITPNTSAQHSGLTATPNINGGYNYNVTQGSTGTLNYSYTIPQDCTVYVYTKIDNGDNITISKGTATSENYEVKRPYIISAGSYKAGETMNLNCTLTANTTTGTAQVYVAMLNRNIYDNGINQLKEGLYNIDSFNTDSISGTITAKEDGLMYTSIPYEKGWKAYVDGAEVEITPIADAMVAVPLTAGEHTVTFKYVPDGFIPALAVTILCIGIFIAIIIIERAIRKKGQVMIAATVTEQLPWEVTEVDQTEVKPVANNRPNKKKKK
ncbi:MAG TPA: YfhO family protein [Clostridiales bacterium]|nr:YfhO family protein [Clostridiales bacterium]